MSGRKKHRTRIVGRLYKNAHKKAYNIKSQPKKVSYDLSEADRILAESLQPNFVTTASPTGVCLDCGKKVTGERKLCGQCLNKHEERREPR